MIGVTAVVTGGGGTIGRVAVKVLLDLGAGPVFVCGRGADALAETAAVDPDRVRPTVMDVGDEKSWIRFGRERDAQGQTVGALVTAAGINRRGPFDGGSVEDWEALWRTNVLGTLLPVRQFLPGMVRARFGRVVLVSSIGGHRALPDRAVYSATKGAVEAFGRSVAAEVGGSGVTVNTLAPGVFPTQLTKAWLAGSPDRRQEMLTRILEGRFGEASELEQAFRFLFASTYTQGSVVDVDGGWSAG